jgi:CubicO group peptidase (beta-lactamase class C family)
VNIKGIMVICKLNNKTGIYKILILFIICHLSFNKTIQSTTFNCEPIYNLLEDSYNNPKYRLEEGLAFIMYVNEKLTCRNFFGPMTDKRIVKIASASKWLSAATILSLIDSGDIALDDPIDKYLNNLIDSNDHEAFLKRNITIRQLLSHTHGLSDEIPYNFLPFISMKEAVKLILQKPLLFEPGSAFSYGGVGMQVAGYIGEHITGKSWQNIFYERIAQPLSMKNTRYTSSLPYITFKNPNIAGGLESTLDELGNFVLMIESKGIFNGMPILSGNSVKEMLHNQTNNIDIIKHPWNEYITFAPDIYNIPYGLGVWLEVVDNITQNGLYAQSSGLYGTVPFVDVERHVAGVLLSENKRTIELSEGMFAYEPTHIIYIHLRNLIKKLIPIQ